jgi:hypothetical protein
LTAAGLAGDFDAGAFFWALLTADLAVATGALALGFVTGISLPVGAHGG